MCRISFELRLVTRRCTLHRAAALQPPTVFLGKSSSLFRSTRTLTISWIRQPQTAVTAHLQQQELGSGMGSVARQYALFRRKILYQSATSENTKHFSNSTNRTTSFHNFIMEPTRWHSDENSKTLRTSTRNETTFTLTDVYQDTIHIFNILWPNANRTISYDSIHV